MRLSGQVDLVVVSAGWKPIEAQCEWEMDGDEEQRFELSS